MNKLQIFRNFAGNNKSMNALLNDAGIDLSYSSFNRYVNDEDGEGLTEEQQGMFRKAIFEKATPDIEDYIEILKASYILLSDLVMSGVLKIAPEEMPDHLSKEEEDELRDKHNQPKTYDMENEAEFDDFLSDELKVEPTTGGETKVEEEKVEPVEETKDEETKNEVIDEFEDLLNFDATPEPKPTADTASGDDFLDGILGGESSGEPKDLKTVSSDGFESDLKNIEDVIDKQEDEI